ncbi:MAG: hypothetical protein EOL89_10280 [Actinobacteria bacterium]|nr:hypothetical protein [Actinomycetota bacterium]
MTDHDDATLDRLRAADPAHGTAVDLTRLRAAVDARIAAEEGGDGAASVTDLGRAPSRRRRWAQAAGAAASAVVVGAIGFGLGSGAILAGGGDDSTFDEAATSGMAEDAGGAAPQEEAMAGGADGALAPDAERMIWPGWSERQVFRAVGLPDESGTATTWAFDATGAWSAESVAEIAAVLGVEGEPELVDGSWTVGPLDGSAAQVMVYPDGQAGLNYYDPATDPWNCEEVRDGTAAECPDLGPAPGDDEARQLTRDLLAELGLDPEGFEYEISKDEGSGWISVAANQVLDGSRTSVAWWASFTGAGLQSLSGSLATLVELGDYPVVGAAEAVTRITDPRFGTIGGFSILPAARGGAVLEGDAALEGGVAVESEILPVPPSPTEPPAPPAAGSPVPWPVEEVAITSAELGLAQWTTADGASLLVPAWELTAEDGRTWTVLALAEDALDMSATEE